MSRFSLVCLLAVAPLFAAGAQVPLIAQAAPGLCQASQDDQVERLAPAELLPPVARTFGVPARSLRESSFVRSAGARLLGCMVGANLNCGRADVSRRSPGADAFCKDNSGSDSVPMAATGHDTIFKWRCAGTHAVAGSRLDRVDRLGFTSRNWRPMR